jgi:hypothetical protein
MGTTAGGLPYPEGTDHVVDGDDAIQALAEALQLRGHGSRLEARRVGQTTSPGGYTGIVFQTAFAAAPVVVAWVMAPSAGASWYLSYDYTAITATGVGVYVRDHTGVFVANASLELMYLAVGPV